MEKRAWRGVQSAPKAPRSQAPVRSQMSKVNWRRKSEVWKREKEEPGGEETTVQS